MIWLLLSSGFAEEGTLSQSNVKDEEIVVFHYGLDPVLSAKIALNYVQAVTDYSAERLSPLMMDDVFPVARSQVQGGTSEHCLEYPVSPILFTKLIQEIEYSLSYFEYDKAQQVAERAQANLGCLSEPPDLSTVANLFYLQALTYYYNNENESAQDAFLRAITYKPNMGWNDMYAPDAQATFDAARKHYADLTTVPLTVYPESAKGRLWINGIPVYRDVPLTLTTGTNYLQILGEQIENITLEIDAGEDAGVNLVVPSAIDEIGLAWLDKPNKRAEVGTILNLMYPNNPTYFISEKDSVWEYNPSSLEWQEYPIPISAKVFSLDTRRNVGRGFFWGGLAISGLYGSKAAQDYVRLTYLANSRADTWTEFNASYQEFQSTEESYQRSATMALIGASATGLGWLMSR